MAKRQTIGANPLDTMVPVTSPATEAGEEQKSAKDRCTFHLSMDLMERVRNCVFWTPGLTMADIAEEGIRRALEVYEKKNGGPFPPRKHNLKGGRPMKG